MWWAGGNFCGKALFTVDGLRLLNPCMNESINQSIFPNDRNGFILISTTVLMTKGFHNWVENVFD